MLAKDDDWLTAGNQLDDSLLMDDLWDDDAAPQDDKSAASHSTGSKAMVQEVVPMYPQFRNPTGNPFPVKMRTRFHSILMTHFHSLTKAQPISPTATHFNRKT